VKVTNERVRENPIKYLPVGERYQPWGSYNVAEMLDKQCTNGKKGATQQANAIVHSVRSLKQKGRKQKGLAAGEPDMLCSNF
jgi:hypothetical protein